MNVLIAYDGSDCSHDALLDLIHAGLPQDVDATLLTVVDDGAPADVADALGLLQREFPTWSVRGVERSGSPVDEISAEADERGAHLIVMGSHKRSWIESLYETSVSRGVVRNADCVVRVGRRRERGVHDPLRILVSVDGSRFGDAVVHEVASRIWPRDTRIGLITLIAEPPSTIYSTRDIGEEFDSARRLHQRYEGMLESLGLEVSSIVREDEAISGILNEAHDWGADCIYLGARGLGALARLVVGSVSSAVAARAECSVEVVHVVEEDE